MEFQSKKRAAAGSSIHTLLTGYRWEPAGDHLCMHSAGLFLEGLENCIIC